MENIKARIGISIGDINGIGIEVILKTLSDSRIYEYCTPIVYGSVKTTSYHKKLLGIQEFNFQVIRTAAEANLRKPNLINCWEEEVKIEMGQDTENGGKYALKSLEAAMEDLLDGKIDALVTAPINKSNIQKAGFSFPGHTEYLQQKAGMADSLMFMLSEDLKIGVVTGHMPISQVAASITKESILSKLRLINKSLKNDFWIEKPKIAVLGLNPHAGDRGLLGKEEEEIIIPTINKAFEEGIMAFGPFPADGFFGQASYLKFDAVLAMYHDQGLIPFKHLSFGKGVNFTAGLTFIRTSPDHGVAYDIAGKAIANEGSFREALFTAADLFRKREEQKQLQSHPLKITKLAKDRD